MMQPSQDARGSPVRVCGSSQKAFPLLCWGMEQQPELYVECATAEEVGRALARGYTVAISKQVAAQCGAPPPGNADLELPDGEEGAP